MCVLYVNFEGFRYPICSRYRTSFQNALRYTHAAVVGAFCVSVNAICRYLLLGISQRGNVASSAFCSNNSVSVAADFVIYKMKEK